MTAAAGMLQIIDAVRNSAGGGVFEQARPRRSGHQVHCESRRGAGALRQMDPDDVTTESLGGWKT